jgi:hydroxymethylbilane synthase
MKKIRIGTRNSQLALWQANTVRDGLLQHYPGIDVELVGIISEGDRTLDIPLHQAGGKGLFLKELESALVAGEIDLAVHSMKDVTVKLPDGLHIPVLCPREDARDAFVSNQYDSLDDLPKSAVVGTCSLRRQCQVRARYPHLELKNLRGNVNTRLGKLDAGQFDAVILAAAGLKRLGMSSRIRQFISPDVCLPAVGQGIVGVECRVDDDEINGFIRVLNDDDSSIQVGAERQVNTILDGGCHAPLAVYAEPVVENGQKKMRLRALVGRIDGSVILRSDKYGAYSATTSLGFEVATDLLDQGAAEIISAIDEGS